MMKQSLLIFFILSGIAQMATAIYFRHFGVKDGLSQISVMSIYQDELGRMWFGTQEGVSLYDGKEIISFKHSEDSARSTTIPLGNETFPVTGDQNGNIYFRSDARLIHYDVGEERFYCLKNENVTTVSYQNGTVFFASSDSVCRWDPESKTFHIVMKTNITGNRINKIFVDSKERLWTGCLSGLYLKAGNGELKLFIEEANINEIVEDSQSNIWITTQDNGFYKYSRDSVLTSFRHDPDNPNSIPHNQVRSLTEDNYGNLWIGTFRGLCKYNPMTGIFTTYRRDDLPGSLHHSSVYSTFKDRQGTIWIGTYYGGVHYFNPETDCFSYYSADIRRDDCLSHFYVGRMVEDKDQNIWICTEGGGLNFFNRKTKTFRHFTHTPDSASIPHNNLKSIAYSGKYNKLYIGTHTGGLSVYDMEKGVFYNFRDENPDYQRMTGDIIDNLQIYREDRLIIRSRNGFFMLDIVTGKLAPLFDGNNMPSGSVFFIDSKDYIWLASATAIIRINMNNHSERYTYNKSEQGFGAFPVSCIFEDRKGRLFFGTYGSGLYQYDPGSERFIRYTVEQKMLQSNYCYDMAQSELNELIISGDKGLSFLNVDSKQLRTVDLNALLFSGINAGCGLIVCRNGEIFTGGIGGLTSFFEQEVFGIYKMYDIYFSSLSVNDERISPNDKTGILQQTLPYTRKIVLNHKQNNLNISFTSNNYINTHDEDRHEYRLHGFDDKWISGNHIIYTNIPPGKYRLTVREKTTEYRINPKTITMDITVRHAWYASPLAFTAYFLTVSAILWFFLRIIRIRRRLKASLEMEHKEKEQIERLNNAKLQFFTNISHEFHTPLTLIAVQIERLLNSSSVSPFVYNRLLKMNRQANLLQNLINELLYFRKLEQGHITLKVSEINIIPFLKEIFLSFHELSVARNIAYSFETHGADDVRCLFDPGQLQKVFYNLISNAFKYTKPNGSIELSVREDNSMVIINVMDNGIGIEEKDFHRIFDRFYQADNSGSNLSKPSGTVGGIGLSIVKGIVELHHGTVSVESKPSYGSIFSVFLLKGNSHFNRDEISEDTNEGEVSTSSRHGSGIAANEEDGFNYIPENQTDESDEHDLDDRKHTILLVEDSDELLQLLKDMLKPFYQVFSARNGKEGLDVVRKNRPDLIISDIKMPEMSGTELCVAVKNDFETCHIPVILLTALSAAEHRIQGLQHGADDYITKPFDEKTLIARCNNLIHNRIIIKNKFSRNVDFDIQSISNNPIDQKFLDTINRIIEKNFGNTDFHINTLAGELNLSRSSLYAKFEALTGMTPNEYVLHRKLKKASDLLNNNPAMNVSEISDSLCFGSPRYFGRCFKNQFGMSPLEYRKKHG